MTINAKMKSLAALPLVLISAAIFAIAVVEAFVGGHDRVAWLGTAVSGLSLPWLLLRLVFRPVARTSENLPFLTILPAVGVVIAYWEHFIEGAAGVLPLCFAIAGVAVMLVYVYWYSRFGRIASGQLSVGNTLPEFRLNSAGGEEFNSGELRGSPAVVLFYRGNWCPLCMAQIEELVARYRDLADLGVNVVLISPQPEKYSTMKLAKTSFSHTSLNHSIVTRFPNHI